MNELLQFGEALFPWVVQTSWQAGILALVIVLAQAVFRRRLSPAWRYGLWLLLVVRLLCQALCKRPGAFTMLQHCLVPSIQ